MSLNRIGYKRYLLWSAIALGSFGSLQLSALLMRTPAQAQEASLPTEEEIASYANAVSSIEPLRQAAYGSASDALVAANSELSLESTSLSCLDSELSDLSEADAEVRLSLQSILVEFCNEAGGIAAENGLTPQRFNEITNAQRGDRDLAQDIRAAIPSGDSDAESVNIEPAE